ncbi:MAG TPA: hypothetical protein VF395_18710 [Polyangiaceae bacterium]
MAARRKSRSARIEAALRELAEMRVDVPWLLEQLVSDERRLISTSGDGISLANAFDLPRERAREFPLMSPTLWGLLWSVRTAILFREERSVNLIFDGYSTASLQRILGAFVTAIGLEQSRDGRGVRKVPLIPRLEAVVRGFRRDLYILFLESERTAVELAESLPEEGMRRLLGASLNADIARLRAALARQIDEKRALVEQLRRGRRRISLAQAARQVADAWEESR